MRRAQHRTTGCALRCRGCGRVFESADPDYLVLKPRNAFDETTKFLEESFHADGRDETVSPPLLSAGVRNTMLGSSST